jgi:hypothetical protein
VKRKSKTKTLHELSELYGLPYQTLKNAKKRGWPLNDPLALFERFLNAPGKKPPLDKLCEIANQCPALDVLDAPPPELLVI